MMNQFAHGGDIFSLDETNRDRLLDFSVNINPLGMSPMGLSALSDFFSREAGRYPDIECRELKKALSDYYKIPVSCISCGNGATELMYVLMRVLRPSSVYVPDPCFSEYEKAADAENIPVYSYALDGTRNFCVKDWSFIEAIPKKSVIYAGNPNNPDGRFLVKDDFLRLAKAAARTDSWLILDESFVDFSESDVSYRSCISQNPHLIIVTSLTKFFAVPGLRIGCTFSSPEIAEKISSALYPWNVNGPVQLYIKAALSDKKYIAESRRYVQEERKRFCHMLGKISAIQLFPGTVNFILLRLTNGHDAAWLQEKLFPHGFLIRQCGNYKGLDNTYFRLAIRKQDENDKLFQVLSEILS